MMTTAQLHGNLRGLLVELAGNLEQITQDNLLREDRARVKLLTQAWDAVKWDLPLLDRIDRDLCVSIRVAELEMWRYNNYLDLDPDSPGRAQLLGQSVYQSLRVQIALTDAREELAAYLDRPPRT